MESLAKTFQKLMNEFISNNSTFTYHGQTAGQAHKRGTLLLLDRQVDALAPLLHEFTYQAMVQDLLEVKEEAYTYEVDAPKGKIEKQVLLNENDAVWMEFRHQHIAKVLEQLSEKFKEFMETQGAQLAAGKVSDLSKMAAGARELGQYQEMVGKLGQHMNIAQDCMKEVEARQLLEVAQLEQTMATGVNNDGKKTKLAGLTLELEKFLQNADINPEDKVRLLAIFIISQEGIQEIDRRMLMSVGKIPPKDQEAILNLRHLGVVLQRPSGSSKSMSSAALKKAKAAAAEAAESEYQVSRYKTTLKDLTESLAKDILSEEEYPFVVPPPPDVQGAGPTSLRKHGASKWNKSKKNTAPELSRGRSILFMAGGATYSEVRSVYEVSDIDASREVLIGCTSLLTPAQYLEELGSLEGQNSQGGVALDQLTISVEE